MDLRHACEGGRIDLRRTAGDHDGCVRPFARGLADRLPSLGDGFSRHRAGIDHDHVLKAGALSMTFDHLGLMGVQPASKRDHFNSHADCV